MIFDFLAFSIRVCLGFNLVKTPQRLDNWFQRHKQLKDWTNNKKQKKIPALFGCVLKRVFASSDSFCLVTSQNVTFLRGVEWVHCLFLFTCSFRENVTCKIGSFLCSLDNSPQKKLNCFLFGKSNFKMALNDILTYFSKFVSHQGQLQKFLQHISHSHTYMYFAHPLDFFA